MLNLSNWSNSSRDTIEERIDALRDELASLARQASRRGEDAYDTTRRAIPEMANELEAMLEQAWPIVRRRARRVERVARDNPTATAAAVGLIVLGLLATFVYSRR